MAESSLGYNLFVEHSCPICSEAEALLQSRDFAYDKYYTTASHIPSHIYVWMSEFPTLLPKETIPAVPALFDKGKNVLICGLQGIDKVSAETEIND
jgi:glutaredoxin